MDMPETVVMSTVASTIVASSAVKMLLASIVARRRDGRVYTLLAPPDNGDTKFIERVQTLGESPNVAEAFSLHYRQCNIASG
jgi:hypothetical protein